METNDSPKSTAHEQHRTRIDGYSPYPRSGSSWTAREKKKKTEQASRDAVYTPRTISSLTELETTTKQTNKQKAQNTLDGDDPYSEVCQILGCTWSTYNTS